MALRLRRQQCPPLRSRSSRRQTRLLLLLQLQRAPGGSQGRLRDAAVVPSGCSCNVLLASCKFSEHSCTHVFWHPAVGPNPLFSLLCSSEPALASGKSDAKHGVNPASNDDEKADEGSGGPRSVQIEEALGLPPGKRPRFEKCGECKYCLNPKLKKACNVVRLQRLMWR